MHLEAAEPFGINGLRGLRMIGGELRINPKLPEAWNGLRYSFLFS